MRGVHPYYILTYSVRVRAVITDVMPHTIHYLCIWHIYSKLPKKIKGVHDYEVAKKEFFAIVQESLTIN